MLGRVLLWPFRWATWLLLRVLLWFRYKMKVVGKREVLKKPGRHGRRR